MTRSEREIFRRQTVLITRPMLLHLKLRGVVWRFRLSTLSLGEDRTSSSHRGSAAGLPQIALRNVPPALFLRPQRRNDTAISATDGYWTTNSHNLISEHFAMTHF